MGRNVTLAWLACQQQQQHNTRDQEACLAAAPRGSIEVVAGGVIEGGGLLSDLTNSCSYG